MTSTVVQTPTPAQTPAQVSPLKTRDKWVALATVTVPLVVISAFAIVAMTYTGGGWFGAVSAWFTSGPSLSVPLFGPHLARDFFINCWIGLALTVAVVAPLLAHHKEKSATKAIEKPVAEPMWYTPEPGQGAINLDWIQKVLTIRENRARERGLLPTT